MPDARPLMADMPATFWDHLEVLRRAILRSLAVVGVAFVVAFAFKDELFGVVLAASRSESVWLFRHLRLEPYSLRLINTGLAEQFAVHVKTALFAALLAGVPWAVVELLKFVSPGLYSGERKVAVGVGVSGCVMFAAGVAVSYMLVFPLTVRFLGTYSVSPDVEQMLSLGSYVDALLTISFLLGVMFELPVVCALLAKAGMLSPETMRRRRREAVVGILVVAAVVTPSTDALTLLAVSCPLWILYEMSVVVVMAMCSEKQVKK